MNEHEVSCVRLKRLDSICLFSKNPLLLTFLLHTGFIPLVITVNQFVNMTAMHWHMLYPVNAQKNIEKGGC
jgi:hypothetical protein